MSDKSLPLLIVKPRASGNIVPVQQNKGARVNFLSWYDDPRKNRTHLKTSVNMLPTHYSTGAVTCQIEPNHAHTIGLALFDNSRKTSSSKAYIVNVLGIVTGDRLAGEESVETIECDSLIVTSRIAIKKIYLLQETTGNTDLENAKPNGIEYAKLQKLLEKRTKVTDCIALSRGAGKITPDTETVASYLGRIYPHEKPTTITAVFKLMTDVVSLLTVIDNESVPLMSDGKKHITRTIKLTTDVADYIEQSTVYTHRNGKLKMVGAQAQAASVFEKALRIAAQRNVALKKLEDFRDIAKLLNILKLSGTLARKSGYITDARVLSKANAVLRRVPLAIRQRKGVVSLDGGLIAIIDDGGVHCLPRPDDLQKVSADDGGEMKKYLIEQANALDVLASQARLFAMLCDGDGKKSGKKTT